MNIAIMLLHDLGRNSKTQSRTFACRFGGKEWFKNLGLGLSAHPSTVVRHADIHIGAVFCASNV